MYHDRSFTRPNPPGNPRREQRRDAQRRLQGTAALFLFGIFVLGFLVAIDRPEWFHIRPATGTSVALSHVAGDASIRDRTE